VVQVGLGFTPWHSALTTVPWAGGAFIGSALSGMLMGALGRRVLQIGLAAEAGAGSGRPRERGRRRPRGRQRDGRGKLLTFPRPPREGPSRAGGPSRA